MLLLAIALFASPLLFTFHSSAEAASPPPFSHPGIHLNNTDLSRMKNAVINQIEPIYSAYNNFAASSRSAKTYTMAGPVTMVSRDPTVNMSQFDSDSIAVRNQAIMWYITGDSAHAEKAISILNAWAGTLTVIQGATAGLGASYNGLYMLEGAEIIRYTYPGVQAADITTWENWFKAVFYGAIDSHPDVGNIGNYNIAGLMGIAVFTNNQSLYNLAVNQFRNGDAVGLKRNVLPSGQSAEAGRDQTHTMLNLHALAKTAQIAYNQGTDLYADEGNLLLKAAEYYSKYNLGYDVPYSKAYTRSNYSQISDIDRGTSAAQEYLEMVYAHYHNKKDLPGSTYTRQFLDSKVSAGVLNEGVLLYRVPESSSAASAPNGLSAVAVTADQVDLTWNRVSRADRYNVKRATSSGGPYVTIAANIPLERFSATGLSAGTSYYFIVSAINASGIESANSSTVHTTTLGATLSAPSALTAVVPSSSRIDLTWTDNSNNEIGFKIERATTSSGPFTQVGTVERNLTAYTDLGLAAGTTYYYRVRAYNNAGSHSPYTATFSAVTALDGALPTPWQTADIGNVGVTGSANYDNGTFRLKGGGTFFRGSVDTTRFAYQQVSGDFQITARVNSVQQTNDYAYAGVMVRASLDAAAVSAKMAVTPFGQAVWLKRTAVGSDTVDQERAGGNYTPGWVKIVRQGNQLAGYYSKDGLNWTGTYVYDFPLNTSVYVGLLATSMKSNTLSQATFDNVSIVPLMSGTKKLISRYSGKALDNGNTTNNGANVIQWTDNGGNPQRWSIVRSAAGFYKLINIRSGLVLDNGYAAGQGVSVNMLQKTDEGSYAQMWDIVDVGGGYYKLINVYSGKALDNRSSTAEGAIVTQWTDNGGNPQQWRILNP
jgi:regulation of enolase protein 1 (concanavalin A-like superfamily)